MELVANLLIEDETVVLDDKNFEDCVIKRCVLEYSGHLLKIERTEFSECRLMFRGEASRTLQFLQCMGYMPEALQGLEMFSEIVN